MLTEVDAAEFVTSAESLLPCSWVGRLSRELCVGVLPSVAGWSALLRVRGHGRELRVFEEQLQALRGRDLQL